MRSIYVVFVWIMLLIGGALFTMLLLVPMVHHRYDDHGAGEYYGIIRLKVYGHDPMNYLEIVGQSRKSYRCTPPERYVYDSLDLMMITADGRELHGRLAVPAMILVIDEKTQQMTEESFATLLLGPEAPVESVNAANEIFAHLRSAGTGEFLPPRHHHYSLGNEEALLFGSVAHWSIGMRIPHLLICWIVSWFFILLLRVISGFGMPINVSR